ncbi:Intracellular distribution of mitochondria, partial [Ascosphaera acerosa]
MSRHDSRHDSRDDPSPPPPPPPPGPAPPSWAQLAARLSSQPLGSVIQLKPAAGTGAAIRRVGHTLQLAPRAHRDTVHVLRRPPHAADADADGDADCDADRRVVRPRPSFTCSPLQSASPCVSRTSSVSSTATIVLPLRGVGEREGNGRSRRRPPPVHRVLEKRTAPPPDRPPDRPAPRRCAGCGIRALTAAAAAAAAADARRFRLGNDNRFWALRTASPSMSTASSASSSSSSSGCSSGFGAAAQPGCCRAFAATDPPHPPNLQVGVGIDVLTTTEVGVQCEVLNTGTGTGTGTLGLQDASVGTDDIAGAATPPATCPRSNSQASYAPCHRQGAVTSGSWTRCPNPCWHPYADADADADASTARDVYPSRQSRQPLSRHYKGDSDDAVCPVLSSSDEDVDVPVSVFNTLASPRSQRTRAPLAPALAPAPAAAPAAAPADLPEHEECPPPGRVTDLPNPLRLPTATATATVTATPSDAGHLPRRSSANPLAPRDLLGPRIADVHGGGSRSCRGTDGARAGVMSMQDLFHLEHAGARINDFVELSEVPGLKADAEITLVEDPYTEKEARMHVVRIRELIGAAGNRVDSLHGLLAAPHPTH